MYCINVFTEQYGDSTVSPQSVFTNSELSLRHTTVYGFDYDFTLVHYTSEVMRLIYDEAKRMMVERWGVSLVKNGIKIRCVGRVL